jgi:hypothetical protein
MMRGTMPDINAAAELKLYIDNDEELFRRQTTPIRKNLVTKRARGQYKHPLAVKAFGYLTEAGAKKYNKEFGTSDLPWHKVFDAGTRKLVAEELAGDFEAEAALGNYDHLLPKKYQKPTKASGRVTSRTVPGAPHFPGLNHSTIHHAIPASDIREFRGFLGNASDRQVEGIYEKERRAGRDEYAELAAAEAERRGIVLDRDDHARRKSHAKLKREIASVLGTRRFS